MEIELVDVGDTNSGVINANIFSVRPRWPINVYINQYFLRPFAINSHDHLSNGEEEEEKKFADWKSTVKDSHGYIVTPIGVLGAIIGVQFKSASPNILLKLFVIVILFHFGSCVVVIHETTLRKTEFGEFMYMISLFLGTLAIVLELFILYPTFGWVALILWSIYFVTFAIKSYQYGILLCRNVVAKFHLVFQQLDDLINESPEIETLCVATFVFGTLTVLIYLYPFGNDPVTKNLFSGFALMYFNMFGDVMAQQRVERRIYCYARPTTKMFLVLYALLKALYFACQILVCCHSVRLPGLYGFCLFLTWIGLSVFVHPQQHHDLERMRAQLRVRMWGGEEFVKPIELSELTCDDNSESCVAEKPGEREAAIDS